LHASETEILAQREEHRPRMFENKVLRRIFGFKIQKVTGEWRINFDEFKSEGLQ
jgi:hypothetical protein